MYIERVRLTDVLGFRGARTVDLRLPGPGWTVLAGRNGSGKTTFLRALAQAVVQPPFAEGLLGEGSSIEVDVVGEGPAFCAGYGPFRRLAGGAPEAQSLMRGEFARVASLFSEDASLAEGVAWLINQHLRALEGKAGALELKESVLRLLGDGLLPDGYRVRDVDSDGLWVSYRGDRFPLREMSDGYRTVTALVVDLVRQLAEVGLSAEDAGVVLIDEVDAHLHVSWQKRIGPWLKAHFPRIQFVVSTHSPYVCQAADPGGLIRLPGPDEQVPPRVVSAELYQRVVFGSGDDAVLSDLFGLDSPYSPRAVELREHLAELEMLVASGQADAAGVREWEQLRERLSSSPPSRVDDVTRHFDER